MIWTLWYIEYVPENKTSKAWDLSSVRTSDIVQAAAECGESYFTIQLTPQSSISCDLDESAEFPVFKQPRLYILFDRYLRMETR